MPVLAAAVVAVLLNVVVAALDSSTVLAAINALAAVLTGIGTILGVRSYRRNGNQPPPTSPAD